MRSRRWWRSCWCCWWQFADGRALVWSSGARDADSLPGRVLAGALGVPCGWFSTAARGRRNRRFWLLVGGCGFGWLAAFAGLADLLGLSRDSDPAKLRLGLWHAGINGTAFMAFSALAFAEYAAYPKISHGAGLLVAEAIVLAAMFVGNYFGGAIVWRENKLPVP